MGRRTGTADLPLHHGSVPRWLSERMARLAGVIVEAITLHYGRAELLRRLVHPFWFQSFGAVMGQDWHSSGITTSTVWALKRALSQMQWSLGVHVCGGRGSHSRKTPDELRAIGDRTGLNGDRLGEISRLVAKVDNAAVQDGFGIYLHTFVVTDDGDWAVVQQGMNAGSQLARRYHWLSEGLRSFVDSPHAAIDGQPVGEIINLTDYRAAKARQADTELARGDPELVIRELKKLAQEEGQQPGLLDALEPPPSSHVGWPTDASLERRRANLAAELIYGAPSRFGDPARFSFAHGGKDGHPFPVPLKVYDETMRMLRQAVARARLGNDDKLAALRALDRASKRLDRAGGPSFDAIVAKERMMSPALGGRTAGSAETVAPIGKFVQP